MPRRILPPLTLALLCAGALPGQQPFSFAAADAALDAPLTPVAGARRAAEVWAAWCEHVAAGGLGTPALELPVSDGKSVAAYRMELGEFDMPFHLFLREPEPRESRPLFICMHGGGGKGDVDGPHGWDVNTREFQTQTALAVRYYKPDGLYLIPRMADDRKGRWRHAHHQQQFDRLIETAIATLGVDPDRVYILGISQGGYGTDILAPFMADRFAGADAMAAGENPGRYHPENLRHVAFRTDIGENDTTYDRVGLARRFHAVLDELAGRHAAGEYRHLLAEQAGRGHGIDYRPGVSWIAQYRRDPWPAEITWTSDVLFGQRRPAFYWLGLDAPVAAGRVGLQAWLDREANAVHVTSAVAGAGEDVRLRIYLRDELLDLGRPVTVVVDGEVRHRGVLPRTLRSLVATTALRGDPRLAFPVSLTLPL